MTSRSRGGPARAQSVSSTDPQSDSAGTGTKRPGLSRERVVSAAIALIDERGARALTMASVGERLGVEAMSLYRYVPGREHLLDAIVETVMGELAGDPDVHMVTPPTDWQDYLVRLAHGVRRIALTHPQVFPLVASRPPEAPWIRPPLRSLAWIESFIETLLGHGFDDDGAVAAYRGYSSFLLGHLLLEVSALGADVSPVPEQSPPDDNSSNSVPLEDFPQLNRLLAKLSADHSRAEFEASLENLLDRLALLLPGRSS